RGRADHRHARLRQHRGAEQVRTAQGHRRMSWVIAIFLVFLLAAGSFFIVVGSLGMVKLSEFFKRLHAPTKASTLGVGCLLLASCGYHWLAVDAPQPRELQLPAFRFSTAQTAAHRMATAALSLHMAERPAQPGSEPVGEGRGPDADA